MDKLAKLVFSLLIALSPALTLWPAAVPIQAAEPFRVVAYFPEWGIYSKNYQVANIPADSITHINYAFAKIKDNKLSVIDSWAALDKPSANFAQLKVLKQQHPHLKTLISVGGWTESGNFSAMAASAATRKTFIDSTVAFLQQHGFDGLDIDWEYPVVSGLQAGRPEDRDNFTALVRELRAAFGDKYLLTAAMGAFPQAINAIDYANATQYLDWVNVMSYDFHGAWEAGSGKAEHQAALYDNGDPHGPHSNASASVKNLKAAGVPANKIVLGIPFYGRSFGGTNGLLSTFSSAGPGTSEAGFLDYTDIKNNYLNKNGYEYFWDEKAQAPYLYNKDKRVFISFDDARSVAAKTSYAREQGLGGVMAWELTTDNGDLLAATKSTITVAPPITQQPEPVTTQPAAPILDTDTPATIYKPSVAMAISTDINTDKRILTATSSNAACVSGTRIKTTSTSAVYYCGADGKRYVFPNGKVYATWFKDFNGVTTISSAQMASIPLGGNVTYRPGVKMIKIQSDPKVYAVDQGGILRWISSGKTAAALYGQDWNQKIDDVSEAFFFNYTVGAPIE